MHVHVYIQIQCTCTCTCIYTYMYMYIYLYQLGMLLYTSFPTLYTSPHPLYPTPPHPLYPTPPTLPHPTPGSVLAHYDAELQRLRSEYAGLSGGKREALENLLMEGDLLEVMMDEVQQLWQLLQMDTEYLSAFDTSPAKVGHIQKQEVYFIVRTCTCIIYSTLSTCYVHACTHIYTNVYTCTCTCTYMYNVLCTYILQCNPWLASLPHLRNVYTLYIVCVHVHKLKCVVTHAHSSSKRRGSRGGGREVWPLPLPLMVQQHPPVSVCTCSMCLFTCC